jgi:hypothetical protein
MPVSTEVVYAVLYLFVAFAVATSAIVQPPANDAPPERNKAYNEQVKLLANVFAGLGLSLFGFGVVQPLFRVPSEFGLSAVVSMGMGLVLIWSSLLLLRLTRPEK